MEPQRGHWHPICMGLFLTRAAIKSKSCGSSSPLCEIMAYSEAWLAALTFYLLFDWQIESQFVWSFQFFIWHFVMVRSLSVCVLQPNFKSWKDLETPVVWVRLNKKRIWKSVLPCPGTHSALLETSHSSQRWAFSLSLPLSIALHCVITRKGAAESNVLDSTCTHRCFFAFERFS